MDVFLSEPVESEEGLLTVPEFEERFFAAAEFEEGCLITAAEFECSWILEVV